MRASALESAQLDSKSDVGSPIFLGSRNRLYRDYRGHQISIPVRFGSAPLSHDEASLASAAPVFRTSQQRPSLFRRTNITESFHKLFRCALGDCNSLTVNGNAVGVSIVLDFETLRDIRRPRDSLATRRMTVRL
jgi:hypothetical protein